MPWGFLIPYLHMVKRLSRALDHAEAQGSGDAGNLGIGDAGAVQIGGVAEAVPGIGDTAHLGIALVAAHPGGDDHRPVKGAAQGLYLFQKLWGHLCRPAVAVAVTVAGILLHQKVGRGPEAVCYNGVRRQGMLNDKPLLRGSLCIRRVFRLCHRHRLCCFHGSRALCFGQGVFRRV